MSIKMIRNALAAAAFAAFLPLQAQAQSAPYYLLNTQVPTGGSTMSLTVDSANWVAEKFTVASNGLSIDSVNAYLLSSDTGGGDVGQTFTIALYANISNLPGLDSSAANQGQLYQTTAAYTADGWNGASGLNWAVGAGSYWLALEGTGTAQYLQAATGASPLTSVAYYTGARSYTLSTDSTDTFGLQITAVPEPKSMALLLAGLGVMCVMARRRA